MLVIISRKSIKHVLLSFLLLLLFGGCGQTTPPHVAQKTTVPPGRITEFSVPNFAQKTTVPPGRITELSVPISNNSTRIGRIIAGPDGNIWFTQLDVIWRLNSSGRLTRFSLMKSNNGQYDDARYGGGNLIVGPDGKLWFSESGGQIGNIAPNGSITEFPLPPNVSSMSAGAVGPDGNIWFTDPINNLIENFNPSNPSGTVTTFPLSSDLSGPGEIIPGPDGNLWFTLGGGRDQIGRITPNANGTITIFSFPGTSGSGIGPIVVGPNGNIWFIDSNDNKIGRFSTTNPEKTVTEFSLPASDNGSPGHPGASPADIAVGPDGNLWFTEFYGHKIGRISTTGTITEFPLSRALDQPAWITAGPDGNVWFTEGNTYKIGRITSGK